MGSFNTICALTGKVISQDTPTVMVLLTPKGRKNALSVHAWDDYSPIPVVFEGKYNSYGRLEEVALFQSRDVLSDAQLGIANDHVFKQLKAQTSANYENGKMVQDLDGLMSGTDWCFVKKDVVPDILRNLIKIAQEFDPRKGLEMINTYSQMWGNVESIEEAEKKLVQLDNNSTHRMVPIKITYFEKQAYLKLVNEYGNSGANGNLVNKDVFAQIVQNERSSGQAPTHDTRCVMLGEENYSGCNYPAYKLSQNLKEDVKKVVDREALRRLEDLHIQDLTLVNDYFSMLGRSWMPSMVVNQDIKLYGHDQALEFQSKLVEIQPVKKLKP